MEIRVWIVGTGRTGKKLVDPPRIRRAIKYARDEKNADRNTRNDR
ncbi:hypothetical protein OAA43_00290 [bacterium]|nr:hypothetical protein [bacterium]